MAYTEPHMLLQWTGEFTVINDAGTRVGAADVFVGGLRFAGPGLTRVDNDDTLVRIVPVLESFWKRPGMFIPVNAMLNTVKWNRIGADGHYASSTNTRLVEGLELIGANAAIHPTSSAMAVTWTTNATRGLARQGRTFFPTNAPIQRTDFQISVTNAQTMANTCTELIAALNDAVNVGVDWSDSDPTTGQLGDASSACVASVMSPIRSGATRIISGAKVGQTMDVQRRRRNAWDETYAIAQVSSGA
jgi:hypothetical protein